MREEPQGAEHDPPSMRCRTGYVPVRVSLSSTNVFLYLTLIGRGLWVNRKHANSSPGCYRWSRCTSKLNAIEGS